MEEFDPSSLEHLPPMCKLALQWAAWGFFVFPLWNLRPSGACACSEGEHCGSAGKHPIVRSGLNVATTNFQAIVEWYKEHPNANFGINCDKTALLVVDVDPRNGGNEALLAIEEKYGKLPATFEVTTGSGGKHYYFKYPPLVKSKPIVDGVDIKSKGGYVVGPGSMHASGNRYEALHIGDPRGFILEPPKWLVELCTKGPQKPKPPSNGKASPVRSGLFGAAYHHAGVLGEDMQRDGATVATIPCPFATLHTSGKDHDGSTVVFAPEGAESVSGFVHCSHSHCANRAQREYWLEIPEASRAHAKKLLHISPLYEPGESEDSWRASLLFDEKGKLRRVGANASIILKNHEDFSGCLGYDSFKEAHVWLRSPPPISGLAPIEVGPVRDEHFLHVSYYLAARYDLPEFSADAIFSIMRGAAVPFHPVREYFATLRWDGTPRVFPWLTTYLGVERSPYADKVGAWWLVSAIARVLEPGCKADHVLILEGKQGSRKSTALRVLGSPWFADTPIMLDSKDAYQALRGVWIYELQELQSLSKADSDRAKAFFSSPVDLYRKPYDRTTVEILRQCVFAGSVNYGTYLKDGTGNRRYWPVITNTIDIDALQKDRDQLWAEALHMYGLGFRWFPQTQEEHEMCAEEQDARMQLDEDPWIVQVRAAVEGKKEAQVAEILQDPVNFPHCKRDIKDAIRVARCLRELGWTKQHKAGGKLWIRKPEQN